MPSLTHSDAASDRARSASARRDIVGTILIDSQMIDLLRVKSGELQIVTKTRLTPAGRRGLAILTMPVAEAVTHSI